MHTTKPSGRRLENVLALSLLLLAFLVRMAAIESVPPGPRLDEITVFLETDYLRAGQRPLYEAVLDEELLFHYTLAGAVNLMGKHLIVGRWLAIAFDMLATAALYPLGRRIGGGRLGWLAVGLKAVGFWPILYSRFAIRLTCILPFLTAAVYWLWRGLERPAGQERRATLDIVLAGLCLGVSVHTYAFGRAAPALFLAFVAYLLVAHRQRLRTYALPLSLALFIPMAVDAHLLYYLNTHPGMAYRLSQVSGPLEKLQAGQVGPLLEHIGRALTMAIWQGDPEWLYNLSRRPVFDPLTAALFYLGGAVCLWGWKKHWYGALLVWMAVGLTPIVLTWPPASFSHSIAAQPVFYLWAALGAVTAWDQVQAWLRRLSEQARLFQRLGRAASIALPAGLLALNLGLTTRDYFFVWTSHPNVLAEYQAGLTCLARTLESQALPPAVAGGARVDIWDPYNAYGFGLIYRRPDRPVAWYNPAYALAWPPGDGPMTLAITTIDRPVPEPAPDLAERFLGDATLLQDQALPGQQHIKLYRVGGRQALDARLSALGRQALSTPHQARSLAAPINLGNRFSLLAYEAPATLAAGQAFSMITYWETRQAFWDRLVAFTHLIGPDGQLLAQQDRLDVFTDSLYHGLAFAQVHRLQIPPDTPPGLYHLQVGLYREEDQARLPVLVDGQAIADAVWLTDVSVSAP